MWSLNDVCSISVSEQYLMKNHLGHEMEAVMLAVLCTVLL